MSLCLQEKINKKNKILLKYFSQYSTVDHDNLVSFLKL